MKTIGIAKIRSFQKVRSDSIASLNRWMSVTAQASWHNFPNVRNTFPSASQVGACVVFNIADNRYSLIGKVDYELETVDVRFILTHKEYDRNLWTKGC
jgi:mRNA interferase HigB